MQPQQIELDELTTAFVALSIPTYAADQMNFLTEFLTNKAIDLNTEKMKKIFKDKIQVIDALIILNEFANRYENEKPLIDEFQEEIENLQIVLNDEVGLTI
ncbi:MAG: hypothetical protein JSS07_00655 [Proteobacteria bacterium]|nr:hypothetical protein [Pseudomonadota bacterium]